MHALSAQVINNHAAPMLAAENAPDVETVNEYAEPVHHVGSLPASLTAGAVTGGT